MQEEKASIEDISEYFSGKTVMTGWGTKRPYKLSRVRMDLNPRKTTFNSDGSTITLQSYYKEKYSIDLDGN
jgi:hypothetical protein